MLFVLLATANSAGYRYGASDQAFYIPAVLRHLDPSLFPRDAGLIDSQAHLTFADEVVASIIRVTRTSIPHASIALFVLTLIAFFGAIVRFGRLLYRSEYAVLALAAAMTLRHAIAKTGANTLEAYFHPRQLAFAIGLWALGMFISRRFVICALLVAFGFALHPMTTLWFGVWIVVAALWRYPHHRWRTAVALVVLAAVAVLLASRGPLAGRLRVMDPRWLAVIGDKDYLFPLQWPWDVWLTNGITVPIIAWCYVHRRRRGVAREFEAPLVAGAFALLAIFVLWLPFNAARVALAIQLQTSRIFWMLDFLATAYLVAVAAEGRRGIAFAMVIAALSLARGGYTMFIQFPDRAFFTVDLAQGDWAKAMAWARQSDPRAGWLADPGHAAKYGVSLRVAAERDVFLERIKDAAIAMYDRDVAMRVADRENALRAMPWDSPEGARALARRYDLDYLVIDRTMPLPLAYRSGSISIYRLR